LSLQDLIGYSKGSDSPNKEGRGRVMEELTFFTVKEVAGMLKVSENTIRTYIEENKLKAFKVGNKWRISEEDFKKFIQN
jgi:excisionase family DNA binding protein